MVLLLPLLRILVFKILKLLLKLLFLLLLWIDSSWVVDLLLDFTLGPRIVPGIMYHTNHTFILNTIDVI